MGKVHSWGWRQGLAACLALAVGFAATPSIADEATGLATVAPLPLQVPKRLSAKEKAQLEATYTALLRHSGVFLADSATLATALKNLKRSDCDRDDECLAQLGRLAGTLYGLFVAVDLTAQGDVVAYGRAVRDDGKRVVDVGSATQVKLPKGKDSFTALVPVALTRLFEQMKLAELPNAKEAPAAVEPKADAPKVVEPKAPPVVELPAPPMPPVVVEKKMSGKTVAGWTMVGVGAAAAVTGVVVFATAGDVQLTPTGEYVIDPGEYESARGQTRVGAALMGAGVAVAVAGAVLLLVTGDDAPSGARVSAAPVAGGALMTVGGTF